MEIIKKRKEDEFINLVLSSVKPSSNSLSRLSEINRISLKEMVAYLTKLKNESTIDDKQFSELITIACANYIENEVESRVSKAIDHRMIMFLEKL